MVNLAFKSRTNVRPGKIAAQHTPFDERVTEA
jgi:hypothetical protein